MRISGDETVVESHCQGLGREILEVIEPAGAKMPENTPEMRVFRLGLLDDRVVLAVVADHGAWVDFKGIEIFDVLHPARREGLSCINRRNGRMCFGHVLSPAVSFKGADRAEAR